MLRSAWIFLAAILLPSLVLAWLAVRSARDQQVLVEHQQAIISQDVTDSLAKNVRNQIDTTRSEFVQITQDLLNKSASVQAAAYDFDRQLRGQWAPAEVGFAVDLRGNIYSPGRGDDPAARTFREENDRFLSNRENVEVYSSLNSQALVTKVAPVFDKGIANTSAGTQSVTQARAVPSNSPVRAAASDALLRASPALATASGGLPAAPASSFSTPGKEAEEQAQATESASAGSGQEFQSAEAKARSIVTTNSMATLEKAVSMPPPAEPAAASAPSVQTTPQEADSDQAAKKQVAKSASAGSVEVSRSAEDKDRSIETSHSVATMGNVTAAPLPADLPQAAAAAPSMQNAMVQASPDSSVAVDQLKLQQKITQVARQVSPQNSFNVAATTLSNTIPEESDFRRLIGDDTSGALARFLDNKLRLMVWYRPSTTSDFVFGSQLNQPQLLERLRSVLQAPEFKGQGGGLASGSSIAGYCVALLDDTGSPVAVSIPGFTADWKRPFVATEIGETLPHWEAALYLTDPQQMSKSAHTLRLTIGLIVLLLIAAIVAGGSLIATDIRRQVRLARQKTDFVSNVSHELKTPLTSIRMFADLLAEGRVSEPERQLTYLKIISAESARLTRLINNVLDFARQERGAPAGERRACDLVETTRDVVETCLPHLEASGQHLTCEIEAETLPIVGDRDALAQIVLNLISNAEKYGGGEILVRLRRQETPAGAFGCVDVLDHGPGIPPRQVESIFLPFHRLHDSLSSGIPGSGLGLTLARRMARVHGGDITYTPRAGGGSCFTLTVPLTS